LSAVLLVAGVWLVWTCLRWALWDAVWTGSAQACEQARGACWAVIDANWRLLLFGTMAPEQRPAALLATLAVASAVAVAVSRRLAQRQRFGLTMLCVLAALLALSGFGTNHAPLAPVHWGGVLVTVVMAAAAITLALPLAVALALARRSQSKYLHRPALLLIEGVRAVPLAMQLLLAAFVIPVMLGGDWSASKFELALLALVLHTACLLAEVIRGALQAVPESQSLSAQALGMRPAMVLWSILLPQARRIASPAALGVFVGAVKDTSLVMIIGVFDILSAAKAVVADTGWRPFYLEVYAMVALFYFAVCLWLSRLAHRMQS
jgi:His/Glu/Gln/Arg/opine family amino acid ABC transporter permease subunit